MQHSPAFIRSATSPLLWIAATTLTVSGGIAFLWADDPQPAQNQAPPAKEAPAQAPAEQQPNPFLDRLFRNLFGGPAQQPLPPARRRGPPADPQQPQDDTEERGHLDVSLNSDSAATRDLQKLEPYIQRERWHEVATGLQFLVERPNDTFTPGRRGTWNSLRSRAEERLRTLPPDGRRAYLNLYDAVATDLLMQAQSAGDVGGLAEVARRFATTDAGAGANLELARLSFNRGEFVAAIRCIERLDAQQRSGLLSQVDRLQYAYALRQVGRVADADAIVAEVPDAPAGWWSSLPAPAPPATLAREDWPMLFGTAARMSMAVGGEPLLAPRWSLGMTNLYSVAEQIDRLTTDLLDSGRACLPAMLPVAADGCLAVRTLHGIAVLDIERGEVLWEESVDDAAPERLLTTREAEGPFEGRRRQAGLGIVYGNGGDFDQHPLTSLLFRDSVTGLVSSDGRQLFALADHAVLLGRANYGTWWGNREEQPDPYGRDWKSNAIVSYELKTGRTLWRIGGPRLGEVLDPPLAGTYFFGPPTPHDDRLYVIGERDNEISLFVLDRLTGRPLSTQPLANSAVAIDTDMARRVWPCQPAIADGVVVCPTTAGWLVAVDQLDGRLLWAYAINPIPPNQERHRFGGMSVQQIHPLNTRWAPAPPVIAGHRVLFTPQELPDAYQTRQPALVCLDLLTGRELWTREKEPDDLFLGGVFGETVLIVGKNRVQWVSLGDGRAKWESTTFPLGSRPSGHGLAVAGSYYLPLSDGQVWVFQLADGKVTARLQTPFDQRSLGNLVMHRGMLVSVDPFQVRGFAQRSSMEAEIAARRAANPEDLWALVREAEIHQLRGDDAQTVTLLNRAATAAGSPDADRRLVTERRDLLLRSLWTLVEADLTGRDAEFGQILSLSDQDSPRVRRLSAERALARRDWPAAWEHLRALRRRANDRELIEDGLLNVRLDAWLGDRLSTLYDSAPELRPVIDEQFAKSVDDATTGDARDAASLQRILRFHPQGRRLTRLLADRAEQAGEIAAAAIQWRRLIEAGDAAESLEATLHLAALWAGQGHAADANRLLLDVEASIKSSLQPEDGRLARIAELRMKLGLAAEEGTLHMLPDWSGYEFEVVATRPGDQRQRVQELNPYPGTGAFYDRHVFEFLLQTQRLRINSSDGTEHWGLPLQSPTRNQFDQSVGMLTDGLNAYVVWAGIVHSLSLADRRVLWTLPLELRSSGEEYRRNAYDNSDATLQPADQFATHWGLRRFQSPTGMLAAASPEFVIVHGRREISALDPLTGEVLWTRSGVPPQTMVYGDAGLVYVVPLDGTDSLVLNGGNGVPRDNAHFSRVVGQALAVRDGRIVVLDNSSGGSILGLRKSKVRLKSVDAQTGVEAWGMDVNAKTLIGGLGGEALALLEPDGTFRRLELSTGEARTLGSVPAGIMTSQRLVQLIADRGLIYLLIDQQPSQNINYISVPAARINGTVLCFDPRQEGVVWQQGVANQNLLLPHLDQSPVLVFLNQAHESGGFFRTDLKVLDKRTGRELVASSDLITQNQLHQYDVDFDVPRLRLHTYSARLEVRPVRTPPVAPAGEPAPESKGEKPAESADAPPSS